MSGDGITAPSASAGEIVLQDVLKRFGDVTAVDRVSFTIPGGQFFSMLGPSAAAQISPW